MFKRSAKFARPTKKKLPGFKLPFKWLLVLIAVITIVGGCWWVYTKAKTPVEVIVDEVSCGEAGDIKRMLEKEEIRFFWLKSQEIEKKIKQQYPCVNQTVVERKFPLTVFVQLSGRHPEAVFRVIQKFIPTPAPMDDLEASASSQEAKPSLPPQVSVSYGETVLVDAKGVAFEKGTREGLPFVDIVTTKFDIGDTIGERVMRQVMQIWQLFSAQSLPLISAEMEEDKMTLILDKTTSSETEGIAPKDKSTPLKEEIVFSLTEDLERQWASLQLIWKQAKINSKSVVKIDLRFDKPVVTYVPDKK